MEDFVIPREFEHRTWERADRAGDEDFRPRRVECRGTRVPEQHRQQERSENPRNPAIVPRAEPHLRTVYRPGFAALYGGGRPKEGIDEKAELLKTKASIPHHITDLPGIVSVQ